MGPHVSHQKALELATNPLICRLDDDLILDPEFLEKLFEQFLIDENLAAVQGVIPFIDNANCWLGENYKEDESCKCIIKGYDVLGWPLQTHLHPDNVVKDVEHLYSSFMYRTDIAKLLGGYDADLSEASFREETFLTYKMFLSGYHLKLTPEAIAWHFSASSGGTRMDPKEREQMGISDETKFRQWLDSVRPK
jgi:GT2 family glycosyltransferase